MSRIVLASTSASRARLLANAGVAFSQIAPQVDEAAIKRTAKTSPAALAMILAREKAESVSARLPGALVIGADQVLVFDGEAMNKAVNLATAKRQLEMLGGKTHTLETAAAGCRDGDVVWSVHATAHLTMRPFSTAFLDAYLQTIGKDALTSVGAYKLEGLGGQLFERVEGDYFSILGLPLLEVLTFLRREGALAS
jgi:septum formation protein